VRRDWPGALFSDHGTVSRLAGGLPPPRMRRPPHGRRSPWSSRSHTDPSYDFGDRDRFPVGFQFTDDLHDLVGALVGSLRPRCCEPDLSQDSTSLTLLAEPLGNRLRLGCIRCHALPRSATRCPAYPRRSKRPSGLDRFATCVTRRAGAIAHIHLVWNLGRQVTVIEFAPDNVPEVRAVHVAELTAPPRLTSGEGGR
jgi:hypothetical protein